MGKRKKNREESRKLLGDKYLYVSNGSVKNCYGCGRDMKRGMISKYEDNWYCSEGCVMTYGAR